MRRVSSVVQSAASSTQRANSHRSSRSGSRCSRSLIRHTRARVRAQPILAVQQVLQPVIGGVTDVGLRVNHQPRLPLGSQHVLGVQIGAQQHPAFRSRRERAEQRRALLGQTRINGPVTTCHLQLELISPAIAHQLQRRKR